MHLELLLKIKIYSTNNLGFLNEQTNSWVRIPNPARTVCQMGQGTGGGEIKAAEKGNAAKINKCC